MPPKRRAPSTSASASSTSKRAKIAMPDEPPRSKRWSAVSGSANADADYKTTWKNPDKWYSFVTICSPIRDEDEDEEGKDENEDGDTCSHEDCVCLKPLSENPEHPWVVSQAGCRKYSTQRIHLYLRNPYFLGMDTFDDHTAYGCIEVVQNLVLDYVEAAERGWREQWAVCEGLGLFLLDTSLTMLLADDYEYVDKTMCLVGRLFLDMLAQLDAQGLVGDATEVKNMGTIMAVYLHIASESRIYGILAPSDKKNTKTFKPEHFDDAILSYANQRRVMLQGPQDIDDLTAYLDGDDELPRKGAKDPWGLKAELMTYKKSYASLDGSMFMSMFMKGSGIGGDVLDITTWSSADRIAASSNNKDPLGKHEIDVVKNGMVLRLGQTSLNGHQGYIICCQHKLML